MSLTTSNNATGARPSGAVHSGQRVRSAISGETMTFRRTSGDSGGEVVELDLELRSLGAPAGLPHRHLPVERFEITKGVALLWIARGRPRLVRAGDVFEIPRRRWHFLLALRPTTARVSIEPGMRFDELLVTWAALGSGNLSDVSLSHLLTLLREHGWT